MSDRTVTRASLAITALVTVATFLIAYDGGAYSLTSRSTLAVLVWWAILVGVAVRAWPVVRPPRAACVPGALLVGLGACDLASAAWSPSAEDALVEFDRASLYLGIYVLVVLAVRRGALRPWLDGLIAAIVAVTGVALASRFFPGSFPGRGLAEQLPGEATRLSFPVGYWNGLGTLVGLAVPLLVGSALAGGRARRMLSVGVLPALGVALYLTSSRGALLATLAGLVVLGAAHPERASALVTAATGGLGSVAAAALVSTRHHLVDGPLEAAATRAEGRQAAVTLVAVCLLTALAYEALSQRTTGLRFSTRVTRAAWVAAVAGGAALAAFLVWRSLRTFTALPAASGTVGAHLLSGGGSGRWQFWTAALDEFRRRPLGGGGAGSFEAWWARHGSFRYAVRDAHSLVAQTLAELGVVGLALLAGLFGSTVAIGVRRLRGATGPERGRIAAVLGSLTVFALGAAVDWMWELTVVTAVAAVLLGLLAGPASAAAAEPDRPRLRVCPGRSLAVAGALTVLAAEFVVLVAGAEVGASRAAVDAGRLGAARSAAVVATRVEPWAASPYLQLALVEELRGDLAAARRAIGKAIARDSGDWRLWYVRSRIENGLGDYRAGAASLVRARALNPRGLIPAGAD